MRSLLDDHLNLKILELICAGEGTEVNITALSKIFGKHRNTIRNKVAKLFEHKILERPLCPFIQLFDELPLLIIEKDNLQRDAKTNSFIKNDAAIWAAFYVKEEEYNTFLIEFHKDFPSYLNWRESILDEGKITLGEAYFPSEPIFLSTRGLVKYKFQEQMQIIQYNWKMGRHNQLNGLFIDSFTLNLLKHLLEGNGIKINENYLGRQLDVHRRTIKRRIEKLLAEKIILPPVCRFPQVLIPPEYVLVFSLIEIKKKKDEILNTLIKDPHIPVIFKASLRKFNLVIISTYYKIEDFLEWAEEFDQRFLGCIGAVKNSYLSPGLSFSIAQNHVTLLYLRHKMNALRNRTLIELTTRC